MWNGDTDNDPVSLLIASGRIQVDILQAKKSSPRAINVRIPGLVT